MPQVYSGICLTALFTAVVHEHRRLKSEASKIQATVKTLARDGRPPAPPVRPGSAGFPAAGLA